MGVGGVWVSGHRLQANEPKSFDQFYKKSFETISSRIINEMAKFIKGRITHLLC